MTPPRVSAKIPGGAIQKNNTWLLGGMKFLFESSTRYLTSSLRSFVGCPVEHSKRNSLFPGAQVPFSRNCYFTTRIVWCGKRRGRLVFFSAFNLFFCFQVNRVIVIQSCYCFLKKTPPSDTTPPLFVQCDLAHWTREPVCELWIQIQCWSCF